MWGCGFGVATLAARPRRVFSPAQVVGLSAWYDPSDLTTLFQDVAMTVPVTAAGQSVAAMRDKSGQGRHLTQPTVGKRPIFRTSGTVHWLETDGVDDELTVGSRLGLSSNPDVTVVAALRIETLAASDRRVFEIGQGTGALAGTFGTEGWAWRHNNGNAIFGASTPGIDHVATWQRAAGASYDGGQFFRDGVQQARTSSSNPAVMPSNTVNMTTLFSGGTPAVNFAAQRLYGLVVGNFVDRTRAAQIEAWMVARMP